MRVVVADDSLLVREGIVILLRSAGVEVVGEAADADALRALVADHRPDVAIVDIRMPPTRTQEGIEAAIEIRAAHPSVAVLLLSQYTEPAFALQILDSPGSRVGYLLKDHLSSAETLLDALNRLTIGEVVIDPVLVGELLARQRRASPLDSLTAREREVLGLVAEGLSNKAIAARMFVAERTVEAHVTQIFLKLQLSEAPEVHRRVSAVITYLRA